MKSNRQLFVFLLIILPQSALIAETGPVGFTSREVRRPAGNSAHGTLPRSILLIQTQDILECATQMFVFDPDPSCSRLEKTMTGPGFKHEITFLSPLFSGWGVARGAADPDKEVSRKDGIFWFNPLEGKKGATVAEDLDIPRETQAFGTCILFTAREPQKPFAKSRPDEWRLFKFALGEGLLSSTTDKFDFPAYVDGETYLTYRRGTGGAEITRIRVSAGEADSLGTARHENKQGWLLTLSGAGPGASDGVFYVEEDQENLDHWSIWWKAANLPWVKTVSGVLIEKLFGGEMSRFPVIYVGCGRFAYAETIPDSVVKKDGVRKGLTRTVLVEAATGRVLDATKPMEYDWNPLCRIPESWWSPGIDRSIAKPGINCEPDPPAVPVPAPGKNRWLSKEDKVLYWSADGRYEVEYKSEWYRSMSRDGMRFQVRTLLTGSEPEIHLSESQIRLVRVQWLLLCGSEVLDKDMALWALQK